MNEWSWIFNVFTVALVGLIAWLIKTMLKRVLDEIKEITKDVYKLREELPKTYATKENAKDLFDKADMNAQAIRTIEGRMDGMAHG